MEVAASPGDAALDAPQPLALAIDLKRERAGNHLLISQRRTRQAIGSTTAIATVIERTTTDVMARVTSSAHAVAFDTSA